MSWKLALKWAEGKQKAIEVMKEDGGIGRLEKKDFVISS